MSIQEREQQIRYFQGRILEYENYIRYTHCCCSRKDTEKCLQGVGASDPKNNNSNCCCNKTLDPRPAHYFEPSEQESIQKDREQIAYYQKQIEILRK